MAKHQRGFTWLELLPLIITLVICAAILLPLFAKVREKSRQTSCLNNMKQLGSAFQQYSQDNDTCMPGSVFHADHTAANAVNGTGWVGQVWPYLKNEDKLKCSDDHTKSNDPNRSFPISYALNSNTAGVRHTDFYTPGYTVLLFEINAVTTQVKMIDENRYTGASQISPAGNGVNGRLSSSVGELPTSVDPVRYATGILDNSLPSSRSSIDQYVGQTARHREGSNFLLADGHAKWFRPSAVSAGGNASDAKAPQSTTGCSPDGSSHSGNYPCAVGTDNVTAPQHRATFSIQ